MLVSEPGARQHDGGEPGIGKVDGDAARNELRRSRSELERLFDARAQIETRRPGGGILRQGIAQARVEDFYVERLPTKSRLVQLQPLRDVRQQLAPQHQL